MTSFQGFNFQEISQAMTGFFGNLGLDLLGGANESTTKPSPKSGSGKGVESESSSRNAPELTQQQIAAADAIAAGTPQLDQETTTENDSDTTSPQLEQQTTTESEFKLHAA